MQKETWLEATRFTFIMNMLRSYSVQAAEDGRGNGAAVPSIFILKGKIVKLGGHLAA